MYTNGLQFACLPAYLGGYSSGWQPFNAWTAQSMHRPLKQLWAYENCGSRWISEAWISTLCAVASLLQNWRENRTISWAFVSSWLVRYKGDDEYPYFPLLQFKFRPSFVGKDQPEIFKLCVMICMSHLGEQRVTKSPCLHESRFVRRFHWRPPLALGIL